MTGRPLLASRVMKARRQSTCPICRGPVRIGDLIAKTVQWAHAGCVIAARHYGDQSQEGRRQVTVQCCAACGQPARRPRVMCSCGHPITSHEITRSGARTWCAHYGPAGPCRCEKFTQEGTT